MFRWLPSGILKMIFNLHLLKTFYRVSSTIADLEDTRDSLGDSRDNCTSFSFSNMEIHLYNRERRGWKQRPGDDGVKTATRQSYWRLLPCMKRIVEAWRCDVAMEHTSYSIIQVK